MKSIILAAGFAKRLYPITLNKAKPLLEIKNKPLIDYIIDKIRGISLEEIIVITNNNFYGDFLDWKNKQNYDKITILNDGISYSEQKLGAVGDLLFAIDKRRIDEDLFVISGDNFFSTSLKEPLEIFKREKKDLSIFYDTKDINEAKRLGVALIKNNLISDFEEKPINPKSTICSACTYFFRKDTIPIAREFQKIKGNKDQPGLFLEYLYKKVPIYAYITKDKWIDIGTKETLQKAQSEEMK